MPIRVYALAKDLKIDKEDLYDLCRKLDITLNGKSALASLSAEDALRVKEYVSSRKSDSDKRRS